MLNLKLKETIESTLTAEERTFAMEQLLKEEETRIHHVEKELARLRELQVKFDHSCFSYAMKYFNVVILVRAMDWIQILSWSMPKVAKVLAFLVRNGKECVHPAVNL